MENVEEKNESKSLAIVVLVSVFLFSSTGFVYFMVQDLSEYAAIGSAFIPAVIIAGFGFAISSWAIQMVAVIPCVIFAIYQYSSLCF